MKVARTASEDFSKWILHSLSGCYHEAVKLQDLIFQVVGQALSQSCLPSVAYGMAPLPVLIPSVGGLEFWIIC